MDEKKRVQGAGCRGKDKESKEGGSGVEGRLLFIEREVASTWRKLPGAA